MGINRCYYIIWLILCSSFFSLAQSLTNNSRDSLDDLLQNYAYKSLVRPHTGSLYKASLPPNLSAMEVSVVRLRSGSFWARGVNLSGFNIPPRIIPRPFVKRLAIVFQNLGNLSSDYYNLSGYSLVTPVIGFMAYDASNLSVESVTKLNFNEMGDSISIRFPNVSLPESSKSTRRCVAFSNGGSVQLTEMTLPDVCFTRRQGHFAIVVPVKRKGRRSMWKLWVMGFCLGFVGLVLVGLIGFVVLKFVRRKNIGKMEKKANEGVAFETVLVGTSKMPSAAVIRTQPVLENSYVP